MGYWKAWLVPDPSACILSTELLQVFNAWLAPRFDPTKIEIRWRA
jgi:hypothetical protein